MSDDAIDRAIDEVAREMTAGEPVVDLRARAMARIDAADVVETRGSQRRRRTWSAAFAAAAVVLIVVFAYRAARPLAPNAPSSRADASVVPPLAARPIESTARLELPRPLVLARSTVDDRRTPRQLIEITPSPIDLLAPPRINTAPLVIDELNAPSIDVLPLESIAPMTVAPLGQGDRP